MQKIQTYSSPLGNLTLVSNGIALTGIWFEKQKPLLHILKLPHEVCNLPIFDDTKRWLDIYFEGDVPNFTPLLCPEGTHFRQQVWNYLLQIPYGKTTTYGALAKKMAEHLQKQKNVCTSNWRSCRTQSNTYYYSMPSSYWNKRNNDWICQRNLAKRIFIEIRIQKIEWGSGSNFSSYRKNSIYSISPFL